MDSSTLRMPEHPLTPGERDACSLQDVPVDFSPPDR